MIRITVTCFVSLICLCGLSQDTMLDIDKKHVWLQDVVVRNNINPQKLLQQILNDSSFYKAFKTLRIVGYDAFNRIEILDKKQKIKASLTSHTQQLRTNNCRTMKVLDETVTGDFYDAKKNYNYVTAQLYAGLFFTKGTVCGEHNIVKQTNFNLSNKTGQSKHIEQLKMLFFQPGKKIQGIPFIGSKLDVYDEEAATKYNYKLSIENYKNKRVYRFIIQPKDDLGFFKRGGIVVDELTTLFDMESLDVLYRKYVLSYNTGIYNFNVSMEVELDKFNQLLVPTMLRYTGDWGVLFSKAEKSNFTALLSNFTFNK